MSRIDDLKRQPFLFDQGGHGCCGFAAVIMSMLEHDQPEFDALLKCVNGAGFYKKIAGALISNRVKKRTDLGLIDSRSVNFEDARISLGLMIIFKEIFGKDSAVWKDCIKYSENYAAWAYTDASKGGGKLKALTKADVTRTLSFSYKHGDLALPLLACSELLKSVYGDKIKTAGMSRITDSSTFKPKYSSIPNLSITGIDQLQKYVQGNAKRGAILGLADAQKTREDKLKPYNYIVHWVYVPHTDNDVAAKPFTVWTWGARHTWWRKVGLDPAPQQPLQKQPSKPDYMPMMAITFELK